MEEFLGGVFVGAAVVLAVVLIVDGVAPTIPTRDAIAHHAAHYDTQTGAFTWNDEEKKP